MRGIGDNSGNFLEDTEDEKNPYGRNGFIKVARDMRDHPIVGFGKFMTPADPGRGFCYSKTEAFQDLVMECRYTSGTVNNKGRIMRIEPGQLLGAISWLATRWNWTPKAVRVFLDSLQKNSMIDRSVDVSGSSEQSDTHTDTGKQQGNYKGNQSAIITVCNYEIYQFVLRMQGQAKGQADGQPQGNQGATEGQHLKKGIKEEEIDSHTTAPIAPRESGNVIQLSTLAVPATMRDQPPLLPRLTEVEPPKKPRRPKASRTMLAADWSLPGPWLQWTLDRFDVPVPTIALEAERFKEHWLANGEEKADWEMTWRNWCRSPYRKWRPKHGAPSDIIDKGYAPILDAEPVQVDVWEQLREEAARRRAEENGQ